MNNSDYEARLTGAAREALDELVSDYKSRVLLRAHAHAAQLTGEVREISVRDIVSAAQEARTSAYNHRSAMRARIARWYQLIGATMALAGIGAYIIVNVLDRPLSVQELLPFAMAGAGILLGAVGFFLANRRTVLRAEGYPWTARDVPDQTEAVGLFLLRWQELELLVRSAVADRAGESAAGQPFKSLLRSSREISLIDRNLEPKLRQLLDLRNRVVHHGVHIDPPALMKAVKEVEALVHALRVERYSES